MHVNSMGIGYAKIAFTKIHKDAQFLTPLMRGVKYKNLYEKENSDNLGVDLFPAFDANEIIIKKNEIALIPTGIKVSVPSSYGVLFRERSSTGKRGMAIRAGVVDAGYLGEWKVMIQNTSDKNIHISKDVTSVKIDKDGNVHIPYSNAIAQAVFVPNYEVFATEETNEEFDKRQSERGSNMLGSTDKK